MSAKVTREEWLTNYAGRSSTTVPGLVADRAARGYVIWSCYCDYDTCEGWAWGFPDDLPGSYGGGYPAPAAPVDQAPHPKETPNATG